MSRTGTAAQPPVVREGRVAGDPQGPGTQGERLPARCWLALALGVLCLGLSFQGSRGIWEPDEGFYTNVAVGMLGSGDWVVPRLNGEPFLDKPPLLYWSMAVALSAFGVDEWPARLPNALFFAATALLVGALGGRWWGARAGALAVVVYATSLGPFLAANVVTPDTALAFAATLATYLFWRLEEEGRWRVRLGWGVLAGGAVGLGLLAKGPAMLVFAAPLAVFALFRRRPWRALADPGYLALAGIAALVAAPWYAVVIARLPGAFDYLLHSQVTGRLLTADYARNSGTFDGLAIYLPTLLLGSLPWTVLAPRWLRGLRRRAPEHALPRRLAGTPRLLLGLWIWLPLAVLLGASSRLPLYVLPLFTPLALLGGRELARRWGELRSAGRRRWLVAVGSWLVVLLAVKAGAAVFDHSADSRRLAATLRRSGVPASRLIVAVDTHRNGLALYGYRHLEQVTSRHRPYPFFVLPESLAEEGREISRGEAQPLVLVPTDRLDLVLAALDPAARSHRALPDRGLSMVEVRSGAR